METSSAQRKRFVPTDEPFITLKDATLFHIIHIFNISKSNLNQIDDWREYDNPNRVSVDRLEKSKVVREVNIDEDASLPTRRHTPDKSTYKLLLRDFGGNHSFAYEISPLQFLRDNTYTGTPLSIQLGGRLLVKQGTNVLNGVLMLNRNNCEYLGINSADKELVDTLNSGIVPKYIEMLLDELNLGGRT